MLFDGASTLLSTGGWELVPGIGTEDDLRTVLGAVLDRVAAELAERWGPEPGGWAWSRVHTMVSPHPLAVARPEIEGLHPPVDGCPGDGDTVRCGSVTPRTGDRMAAGSVARYVFDLSDWDRSGWVVPHGVSGVRGSGHDLDQRPSWLAGELVPMAYSTRAVDDLAAATEHVPHPAN
jgi:penicillin amidase